MQMAGCRDEILELEMDARLGVRDVVLRSRDDARLIEKKLMWDARRHLRFAFPSGRRYRNSDAEVLPHAVGRGEIDQSPGFHRVLDVDSFRLDVFWEEPFLAEDSIPTAENNDYERYQKNIQSILDVNERHRNELNREGTSRVLLIETEEKPHIGKRFKHC